MAPSLGIRGHRASLVVRTGRDKGGLCPVLLENPVSKGHHEAITLGRAWLKQDQHSALFDSAPERLHEHLSLLGGGDLLQHEA